MAVFVLLVVLSVVLGKVVSASLAEEQARRQRFFAEWDAAVEAAGLQAHQVANGQRRAHGLVHGVPTHADLKLEQANNQAAYRSVIWAKSDGIPPSLELHGSTSFVAHMLNAGHDHSIGDRDFDDLVEVPELDAYVCAALSYPARTQLAQLIGWGGSVRGGMVVCESRWTGEHTRSLAQLVRATAALAQMLGVPPNALHQRLADNALRDPAPEVRLRNLRYLVVPETETPAVLLASTARALLGDVYAPIRLLCAEQVGVMGHTVLRALAADAQLDLSLRLQAVRGLCRPPAPDGEGLRALLVESAPPQLVSEALDGIGAIGDTAGIDAVVRCARSEHDSVRAMAARALGALGQPNTEPVLIGLLSDAASDVQHASAEALGVFGSVAAVEPLLPLADNLVRPRLRQAARGAIGRIQSRLGNVEAGRVSLSDPHDRVGALDIADTSAAVRAGELSLVEESGRELVPRASTKLG